MSPREELERIRDFQARVDEGAASERREWRFGIAVLSPEIPRVWDANYMRIDDAEAASAAGADAVGAEASDLAAGASLAHVAIVANEGTASLLQPGLEALGFATTRLEVMVLTRPPDPPDVPVGEASFDDVAASRRETTLEFSPGNEELADQLRVLDRRLEASVGGRWFAVREGGRIVSRAWLLGDGRIGQVEDVATTPSARGRGLGRAVVSAAALASHRAGTELTFIVADADETVARMYEKLGFERLGVYERFVRPMEPPSSHSSPRSASPSGPREPRTRTPHPRRS